MNRRQLLQSLTVASGLTASVAACRNQPGGLAGSAGGAGSGSTEPVCYSSDWKRTQPDLVLYLPEEPPYASEANDLAGYTLRCDRVNPRCPGASVERPPLSRRIVQGAIYKCQISVRSLNFSQFELEGITR